MAFILSFVGPVVLLLAASGLSAAMTANFPITNIEQPPMPATTSAGNSVSIPPSPPNTTEPEGLPLTVRLHNAMDEVARLQNALSECQRQGPNIQCVSDITPKPDPLIAPDVPKPGHVDVPHSSATLSPHNPPRVPHRMPEREDCNPTSQPQATVYVVTLASDDRSGWSLEIPIPVSGLMGYQEHIGHENRTAIPVPAGWKLQQKHEGANRTSGAPGNPQPSLGAIARASNVNGPATTFDVPEASYTCTPASSEKSEDYAAEPTSRSADVEAAASKEDSISWSPDVIPSDAPGRSSTFATVTGSAGAASETAAESEVNASGTVDATTTA